ncbi:phosphotransferase enzyme family protein [Deinococcus cellulosilyticus]|uniref:Aminoglycoside phosphotransferase domain-containing protein n=1 Tax=Deinococcus cellulosilyticus (strain DSM 18568 / NBRC 106333 / KACC 11606 / 5516J-15) TaxID=1223518 RepID=A0A511N6Q8_DEIC1|nr:phosphotransferase [Deinococcus cellulosilyticus]GEM48534.1 hypothetical protein DC3_41690 [Deinococcus cellulosilyticus NBRC 106333 = KACC 11606]
MSDALNTGCFLKQLWNEPVLGVRPLHPGYEDHASEVWQVTTSSGAFVLRRSLVAGIPEVDFWQGAHHLCGVDASTLQDLRQVLTLLSGIQGVQVPRVRGEVEVEGQVYLVLEKLDGNTICSFEDQPETVMEQLGEMMARIHAQTFTWCGHPTGRVQKPLEDFHAALLDTMQMLVDRFYPAAEFRAALEHARAQLEDVPVTEASLVMLDQDPSQYLHHEGELSGLVDVEAYVIAPAALDLIGLEYVLDRKAARAVKQGYCRIRPFPDLSRVRSPYRLFCRLLSIQGKVPLEDWMNHPAFLDGLD